MRDGKKWRKRQSRRWRLINSPDFLSHHYQTLRNVKLIFLLMLTSWWNFLRQRVGNSLQIINSIECVWFIHVMCSHFLRFTLTQFNFLFDCRWQQTNWTTSIDDNDDSVSEWRSCWAENINQSRVKWCFRWKIATRHSQCLLFMLSWHSHVVPRCCCRLRHRKWRWKMNFAFLLSLQSI